MSNIGIMDPAYFVGKNAILKFYNDTLALNLGKIEQTANCSAHCQLLDALYPGKVPLHKVNFDAKYEYEYVTNFKVLQSVFDSEGITKHVDVPKLIKAKYQDNLEFCQWMKSFYESRSNGNSMYNAIERRQQAMSQYKKGHKHAGGSKLPGTSAAPKPAAISAAPAVQAAKPAATRSSVTSPATVKAAAVKPKVSVGNTSARRTSKPASPNNKPAAVDNAELVKLQVTLETMQRERDFYFGKLREIEILCQQDDATADTAMAALKKQLLDILYHSDGDEFQQPTEGEENDENQQPTDDQSGEVGETFGDLNLEKASDDEQKQQATADDEGLLAL